MTAGEPRDAVDSDALDSALDERLRAEFAPPPPDVFAGAAEQVERRARPRANRRWPWLAAAAALVVVVVIAAVRRPPRGPEGHDGRTLGAMWVAAFEDARAHGFAGPSCCRPGVDLAEACREMYAVALELRSGSGVSLRGCYCGLPTGGCMALLTESGGAPVCVYVVPRRRDPGVELPAGSALHLARREVGGLVLYALSESPARAVLTGFTVPEQ
jgi:hypothetical protein